MSDLTDAELDCVGESYVLKYVYVPNEHMVVGLSLFVSLQQVKNLQFNCGHRREKVTTSSCVCGTESSENIAGYV